MNLLHKYKSENADNQVSAYAWPGGYPLYYITKSCDVLCPTCVNRDCDEFAQDDPEWRIVGRGINWENSELCCDSCGDKIDAAYAD